HVSILATWALIILSRLRPPCEKGNASCDPNPCQNGGICEEGPKRFVCHCPERFRGLYCDSRLDSDCLSYPCQEEQICTTGERVRI
uniref:EGF-like domain-containing protein n=1 Tax=Monopterus albus TaxID=43700 RepID=A0A3Q3IFS2_MONAL